MTVKLLFQSHGNLSSVIYDFFFYKSAENTNVKFTLKIPKKNFKPFKIEKIKIK